MPRLLTFLTFAALAPLVAGAPSAPVPEELRRPVIYFPTRVGDTLVYQQGEHERTNTVIAAEHRDGRVLVTLRSRSADGTTHGTETYSVSPTGVARASMGGHEFTPPLSILKLPAVKGSAWASSTTFLNAMTDHHFAASIEEEVKVPAGTYRAVRVKWTSPAADSKYTSDWWFAPHVGVIKTADGSGQDEMLKSFTPGKD